MSDVVLRQVDPAGPFIVADLADDDTLAGGVGGWASLDRPRRTSAASWVGTPAQTYTLPLVLDGIGADTETSIEGECLQLQAWGLGDPDTTPPALQVTGLVIVAPTSRWVLQDLAWGARERDDSGRRVQQYVTLTLLEYFAPVLLKSPAKKARHNHGGKGKGGGSATKKQPLFTEEGPRFYQAAYRHNAPFAVPGPASWNPPYQTALTDPQESDFEAWVNDFDVPFDLTAHLVDYDMRGFWLQAQPTSWSKGQHFPDTFKTPYDTTFSNESKYATANCPFKWRGDKLVDVRDGTIVFA